MFTLGSQLLLLAPSTVLCKWSAACDMSLSFWITVATWPEVGTYQSQVSMPPQSKEGAGGGKQAELPLLGEVLL